MNDPKHCDYEWCSESRGLRKVRGASGLYCADHAPIVAEQVEDDEREASCDYLDRSLRDTLDPDGLVHR